MKNDWFQQLKVHTDYFQAELDKLQELYSFKLTSVNNQPYFYIKFDNGEERKLRPEDIGAGKYCDTAIYMLLWFWLIQE